MFPVQKILTLIIWDITPRTRCLWKSDTRNKHVKLVILEIEKFNEWKPRDHDIYKKNMQISIIELNKLNHHIDGWSVQPAQPISKVKSNYKRYKTGPLKQLTTGEAWAIRESRLGYM